MIAAVFALATATALDAQTDWRASALQALPDSGEMHLQLIYEEAPDGFMRLGWQRDEAAGLIRFYDRTLFASAQVYETVEGTVRADTAAPVDIAITLFQQSAILTVDAVETDGVMIGERRFVQPLGGEQSAALEVPVTDSMIMRAAVFFLARTLPLDVGDTVAFDWFAPLGGTAATVSLTAVDGGVIETLSGTHETIRLEVRGGTPDNDIYVTAGDGIRDVVRIDVLGQPMRFEAVPSAE